MRARCARPPCGSLSSDRAGRLAKRGADGDLIGDTPYPILGPGGAVDAYPFVDRDGWKHKTHSTIDHYQPPAPRPPREVRLVVVSGGSVQVATPGRDSLAGTDVAASSVALGTDGHTLLALDSRSKQLTVMDLLSGSRDSRIVQIDDGIVGANRDGHSVLVVGPRGAEQLDMETGQAEFFAYSSQPGEFAPSYKHNHIFVATPRGIDLLYLNLGGRTPYTIPLDGPAGAMSMNGSGTRIYTAIRGQALIDVADTEQYAVVDRIRIGGEARSLAISPQEDVLYVATNDGSSPSTSERSVYARRHPSSARSRISRSHRTAISCTSRSPVSSTPSRCSMRRRSRRPTSYRSRPTRPASSPPGTEARPSAARVPPWP